MNLHGIHHITAITADAKNNWHFYTQVLGMRLVKKTVNQDDVSAYHLFYADGVGSPGSDFTFFEWPTKPERRGTNSIIRSGLAVPVHSITFWLDRFRQLDISHSSVQVMNNREVIHFEDPEGQRLMLVSEEQSPALWAAWKDSTVSEEHQIRGLGPVLLSVSDIDETRRFLVEVLGYNNAGLYQQLDSVTGSSEVDVHVFALQAENQSSGLAGSLELHVAHEPHLSSARWGSGAVHHLALRIPAFKQYELWCSRLEALEIKTSGPIDRYYFKSIYFRSPTGILFELATDQPGFNIDESVAELGKRLSLPPSLEEQRARIELQLNTLSF
jgi:glyoxalase family protein